MRQLMLKPTWRMSVLVTEVCGSQQIQSGEERFPGFFPKAVMISWQKNGEHLHENVKLRETIANQDGTFQKRSILTVSAEELTRHDYTCIIQHSSLEKKNVEDRTQFFSQEDSSGHLKEKQ
ncbi:hypothetical protein MHYP_G00360980 [Metynnis hypsauchen]